MKSIIAIVCLGICCAVQNSSAQTPPVQEINGLKYQVLAGLAEVTSIRIVTPAAESDLGYDEHEVRFKFVPMEQGHELLKILENKELDLNLKYGSSQILVGPAYIQKMALKVGRKYAMNLFQTQSINISHAPYFYQSKALEDNLFRAYESVIDGLVDLLQFTDKDSSLVDKNTAILSATEQRALIDGELKYGLKYGDFTNSKFTNKAYQYLKEHNALLLEYEAALAALSKMEEARKLRQAKEEEEQKNKEIDASTPSVQHSKIFRGCYYEVVPGVAEITSIQQVKKASNSKWKYDEHEVLFKFIPEEGYQLLEKFQDSSLNFVLHHRGEKIPVGPAYIEQKKLYEGGRYQMVLYQKREEGICEEQYSYESEMLNNDLFEAFPPRVYFVDYRNN